MATPELGEALKAVAERLRTELRREAAVIVLTGGMEAATGSEDALTLIRLARQPPDGVLHEGRLPTAAGAASSGRWRG